MFTKDDQEMTNLTCSIYENLYRFEGVEQMEEVLNVVPSKFTSQMNEDMLKPFDEQEVKAALFQMFQRKAPGPDGFPAHFFQTHWDLCG